MPTFEIKFNNIGIKYYIIKYDNTRRIFYNRAKAENFYNSFLQ